jgi:pectate lyase
MKTLRQLPAALALLGLVTAGLGNAAKLEPVAGPRIATDPAQQQAPADGWAAMAGGTRGGAAATSERIYTVSTRTQLLAALAAGSTLPRIVKVVGTIDMSEGQPYSNRSDQSARGAIRVPANTTLIGAGPGAGFVNGHVLVSGVSQVIVRNLKIVAPCDVEPVWDPTDGATGNWNAAFDAISVSGADHVWIDHNSFTDVPVTDDTLPIENGKTKQCHDGALDITNASDYVTVSYNLFEKHDKTLLIGSSDSASGDAGRLRITLSNNVFSDITQRAPRVRYGQVHLFNNYHAGSKKATVYAHSYSTGIGKSGQVLSHYNVYAVTGATDCSSIVTTLSADAVSSFADGGSTVNGAAFGSACNLGTPAWTVPYAFTPRPAALVKANALAQAGAGKLVSNVSGTGGSGGTPGTLVPAKGELQAYTDTQLSISFDAAPVLGSSGKITVRRLSDNVVVDSLDISTTPSATDTQTSLPRVNLEIDALGLGAMPENAALARYVWYRPVTISGNTATIRLRSNRLAFNTAYGVTIDGSVFSASINGQAFAGVSSADGWTFTTRSAPGSYTSINVDDTGSTAHFRTLQGALNWVMTYCSTGSSASYGCNTVATPKVINLANGSYPEMAILRRVNNLSIVGESRDGVIVGAENFESMNSGSGATSATPGTALTTSGRVVGHRVLGGGRSALLVETADLLTLTNFTLQNPHARVSAYDNQSEAMYFNTSTTAAAGRLVAKSMNFLSEQDTLQLKGYNWIYRSLVAGNVDFIWGSVMASLFEECEIRTVFDGSTSSAGYILQARATAGDKGFIFLNSSLTAGAGVTQAYLARSGGTTSSTYIDNIAFINTKMGPHILPLGWCVGTGTSKTGTGTGSCGSNPPSYAGTATGASTDDAGWREWGSMDLSGAPLDVSGRLGLQTVTVSGVPTSVVLAKPLDSITGLTTRAEIFFKSTAATGAPGGWVPAP